MMNRIQQLPIDLRREIGSHLSLPNPVLQIQKILMFLQHWLSRNDPTPVELLLFDNGLQIHIFHTPHQPGIIVKLAKNTNNMQFETSFLMSSRSQRDQRDILRLVFFALDRYSLDAASSDALLVRAQTFFDSLPVARRRLHKLPVEHVLKMKTPRNSQWLRIAHQLMQSLEV